MKRTERGVCAASTATVAVVVFLVKPLDFIKPGGGFVGLLYHTAGRTYRQSSLAVACMPERLLPVSRLMSFAR